MPYVDLHVHIDFYSDPQKIADMYEKNKIYTIFVTNLPELYQKHLKAFSEYKYIRLALGLHPQLVGEFFLNQDLFKNLITSCNYIGEVGLDFSNEPIEVQKLQREYFDFVTQTSINKGRVYSIHSKNAEDDCLEILKKNGVKHAIFHWYSGSLKTLNRIIDEGYYFSLNYRMLNGVKGREIIKRVPKEKVLFETDGPFIRYNKKILTPDTIEHIYNEFDDFIPGFPEIVFNNFKRLLIEKDISKQL